MTFDPSDDFALMQAIAQRDRSALAHLYDRHSSRVMAVCVRVLQDTGEAEDAVTDIFYEVWAKADRFDSTRGSPLTYLLTLSRSRAIDRKRSQASRPRVTSDYTDAAAQTDTQLNPVESIDLKERAAEVRAALSGLDPAQREALECSFYDGLSHSEIASKLNRPLGTVKTYIRQGIIQLRERLRTTD